MDIRMNTRQEREFYEALRLLSDGFRRYIFTCKAKGMTKEQSKKDYVEVCSLMREVLKDSHHLPMIDAINECHIKQFDSEWGD